jgi:hypothetical protein
MIGMLPVRSLYSRQILLWVNGVGGLIARQFVEALEPRKPALDTVLHDGRHAVRLVQSADENPDIRGFGVVKISGVPQSRQKPRRARSELLNQEIWPRVTRNEVFRTGPITAKGPPTAFWHIRQWHRCTFLGGKSQA